MGPCYRPWWIGSMGRNQHHQLRIRPKAMVQRHMEVQWMEWFQHSITKEQIYRRKNGKTFDE